MKTIDSFSGEWAFLSNFAACRLKYDGKVFPTSEHAYQAMKTLDPIEYRAIGTAPTAGEAKRLGRKATLRPDWENIKFDVMLDILRIKFGDPWMRAHLMETDDAILVEGNSWHDQIYGDCGCGRRSCAFPGKNMLGKLLMQVRTEIQDDPAYGPTTQDSTVLWNRV